MSRNAGWWNSMLFMNKQHIPVVSFSYYVIFDRIMWVIFLLLGKRTPCDAIIKSMYLINLHYLQSFWYSCENEQQQQQQLVYDWFEFKIPVNEICTSVYKGSHISISISWFSCRSSIQAVQIGIWKCGFLQREENRRSWRKTLKQDKNQIQTQPTYMALG